MSEDGSLSFKELSLVTAIAQGKTIIDAARDCHISERTAHRWLKIPHVKAALELARQEAFNESLQVLRLGIKKAMNTLLAHMNAQVEPTAATQLAAAKTWIEQAFAVHRAQELETRLAELETILKAQGRMPA